MLMAKLAETAILSPSVQSMLYSLHSWLLYGPVLGTSAAVVL